MPRLVPFTYDITGFILLKATSIIVIILKCFNKSVVEKNCFAYSSVDVQLLVLLLEIYKKALLPNCGKHCCTQAKLINTSMLKFSF